MKRRSPKGGCHCNGRFYRGGCFLPAVGEVIPMITPLAPKAVRSDSGATVDALSDAMIHRTEADDLPMDVGYSAAMRRVLRRRSEPRAKDLRTLDRRRRAAVAFLADHPDAIVRKHFAGLLAAYPNV